MLIESGWYHVGNSLRPCSDAATRVFLYKAKDTFHSWSGRLKISVKCG